VPLTRANLRTAFGRTAASTFKLLLVEHRLAQALRIEAARSTRAVELRLRRTTSHVVRTLRGRLESLAATTICKSRRRSATVELIRLTMPPGVGLLRGWAAENRSIRRPDADDLSRREPGVQKEKSEGRQHRKQDTTIHGTLSLQSIAEPVRR
jgi:hypothetical protein